MIRRRGAYSSCGGEDMRTSGRLAALGLAVLSLYLAAAGGWGARLRQYAGELFPPGETAAVSSTIPTAAASAAEGEDLTEAVPALLEQAGDTEDILVRVIEPFSGGEVRGTTIRGGLAVKNETAYQVDAQELLRRGPSVRLPAEGPQILILHTHGSEAYTPAGLDRYEANDNRRTADEKFSVIRVGDELAAVFELAGLRVLHDREIYDYPSYTGSYSRSGEAAERYLNEYPGIAVVLDIHRDALGSEGVVYKTMAEEEGTVASQIMLLAGTDESGLSHPDWRENLALALYLQERVCMLHPTLMRPVSLVPQRYNQHLSRGSLILEVGSSGNTLQEALAAIRLFGEAAAPALAELIESPAEVMDEA